MEAAFLMGPRLVEVREVPIPEITDDEVLVEVTTALTCGTELKAYRQGHRLFKPPMALGHEFVGVVAAVGKNVEGFVVGDRVTAANSAPCERCAACLSGRTNLCENLPTHLLFGAFAEYVRIPAHIVKHNLLHLSSVVPDQVAAFVEPFACVVMGAEAANVRPGETAVVIGGTGAIGLMFLQLLKQGGADPLVATGRKPHRLALAKELGATHAIDATDLVRDVRNVVGAADLVIEITGIPSLIEQSVDLLRPGGRLVLFGGSEPGARASFDLARLHYEEIQLRGVFHHTPRTVRKSLDLLSSGSIRTDVLVSDRMPLTKSAEAMARFDTGETFKIAIAPRGRRQAV